MICLIKNQVRDFLNKQHIKCVFTDISDDSGPVFSIGYLKDYNTKIVIFDDYVKIDGTNFRKLNDFYLYLEDKCQNK